jgi:hypothetical protein
MRGPSPAARVALGVELLAVLVAYETVADDLPSVSTRVEVALTASVLMPATLLLIWLALPLRGRRGVLGIALALAVAAFAWASADLDIAANVAKVGAVALAGFWFLTLFERPSWLVLVAFLVPVVDSLSVWRGPTHEIVSDRPEVFGALSIAFPTPGGGSFQLGLPDVLFFSLFLAAAARWHLRVGWTWLAMTASFGVTVALAVTIDPFGLGGLPALPLLCLAFLLVNADLLLRAVRDGAEGSETVVAGESGPRAAG